MYDLSRMLTLTMEPTKTYCHRRLFWLPIDPESPHPDCRDGVLTVLQQPAAKAGGKPEVDHYLVQRADPMGSLDLGVWFIKRDDPDQEQPYIAHPTLYVCSCMAGRCHAPCCKHLDSLLAIQAAGGFDDMPDEPLESERCGSAFHVDEVLV